MQLPLDQLESSAARAPEIKDGVNATPVSRDFAVESMAISPGKGSILNPDENLEKRKEMLNIASPEPLDFAFERVIGNNDAVYSNFVDLIESAKRKVGKVVVKDGARNTACATGFMVSSKLLLTNWHVFNTKEDVKNSEVEFFYEYDIKGEPMPTVIFPLEPSTFFYSSKELDYCLVAVSEIDISGKQQLSDIGYIFLDPSIGKIGNENEEKLNIIHHPDGDYKQLSIRENLFVKITDTTIWYKTDTAQGSSGSPVFNDQWQAVALHHMGVALKNEQGQYIDKNGNPIPVIDNGIDSSKVVWIANEGIRISVLLSDIFSKFPDSTIVQDLKTRSQYDTPLTSTIKANSLATESKKINNTDMEQNNQDNNIKISFPSSLMSESDTVTVTISHNKMQKRSIPIVAPINGTLTKDEEMLLDEENKKLEDATDYSLCKGFQPNFLGSGNKTIQIPQPINKIKKFIAKVNGSNGNELKYYNYSSIFHSVRMMPVISCVNVAGDPGERLNQQKRQDNWLRDSRLSFDIQLNDAFYKSSGFDRGHMTRREDANWGATIDDALRNANLTCMYTNACPQVPKINRPEGGSSVGLWGKLEQLVLEKGVKKEVGKTSKASVFNGPVFQDDDPVFKGIQVPMDFFKIVLWLTDSNDLKATAFRLSQQKLVSDINFEEIDIDQNTEFKEYQVSINQLGKDTNMDFSAIEPFDTFEGNAEDSNAITEESLKAHINKYNK